MNNLDINFNEIIQMIENRRKNVYKKVNEELILLYLDIGKYISEKVNNSNWGTKVIDKLEKFIKEEYPDLRGFNRRGFYRMKQFYETYKDNEIVSPLVTQLSWTNNLIILSNTKTIEEKEFYIRLCIKENYSKRELERQIESGYYQRYALSDSKLNKNIAKIEKTYPNAKIFDTYSLEFLNLSNNYSEKDLKKSIISNMKNFILEIGKDFTYVGEEYRIKVGKEDFYIDLLFYNRELCCLVAFELKIDKFKPEFISKMDLYLEALDRQEKKQYENPSVGIILCANRDEKVVEYAMSRSMSPTMVSNYTLKLIDKRILEEKLKEISSIIENNDNKKLG